MSRCVPDCHIDDTPTAAAAVATVRSTTAADFHMPDYEVAELTWEKGQLGLHGLGPQRVTASSIKYSTNAGGLLESIVDQATRLPNPQSTDELVPVPLFHHRSSKAVMAMDALVPCSNLQEQHSKPAGVGSTRVGSSCSHGRPMSSGKRARATPELSGSQRLTMDTYDVGFTSTSMGSRDNTIDDHDSVCHSRPQIDDDEEKKAGGGKSSVSAKRSRAAAIHNQSERKRRDKINQRMKILQKHVPNSSKTDKVSMLDEVIEYLKQLQAQVSMMSRITMPSMMLPMAMQQQQQLHMSLMSNPMGLGIGMGMPGLGLMDLNSMNRAAATAATAPNIHANMMPNPFVPMTSPSWDASSSNDTRFQSPLIPDPMAAFLACSSQPTTMEAYSRMASFYQQMQQQQLPPPSNQN